VLLLDIEEIKLKLEKELKPKRYIHSINVMNEAVKLAGIYDLDKGKAAYAGLLHDCARDLEVEDALNLCKRHDIKVDEVSLKQPELLHGPLGSKIASNIYGIEDETILKAIYYHTTGHADMSYLEKIVFLADYTEPGRDFPGVNDIRNTAYEDLDISLLTAMDLTINFVLEKKALLHIDTINARNFLLSQKK